MKKYMIAIICFLLFIFIILGYNIFSEKDDVYVPKNLKKEGFETEEKSAFYKKITTGNTLDDYYLDLSQGKDSEYEEYNFSKESYDFIKLKLSSVSNTNLTYNVRNDLINNLTTYNYEISKASTYLMLEGAYVEPTTTKQGEFTCNTVRSNKLSADDITLYCNKAKYEVELFIKDKNTLLSNNKLRKELEELKK